MKKKFTMLFAALLTCVGVAKAQPEEGKMYRLKENTQSLYLTITEYNRENQGGTQGSVPLLVKSLADDDQVWYFEATGTADQYNIVSKSGYYLYHHDWNVLAYNTDKTKAIVEIVTNGDGTFKIKNGNTGTQYYKSQNVGGTWYPFCDAGENAAATWALEEVSESEFAASEEYTALLNLVTIAENLAVTVNSNIGLAIGEYSQATATALETAISTAKSLAEDEVEQSHVDALQTAMDAVKIILPTAGKYYQFHSSLAAFPATKAVYSDGTNPAWKTLDDADKSFYWLAVETADGGIALKNAKDGKFLSGWTMADEYSDAAKLDVKVFSKAENEKGYEYGIVLNGKQMHANGHNSGAGAGSNIIGYDTNNANSASSWYIVEVELPTFYTVTYNFLFEGDTKYTQTFELASDAAFPTMNMSLPYGVTSDFALPEGTVSENVVKNFVLTVEHELPFETAAAANSITTWYYARMHTNQPGYLGDIADGNAINVAWGKASDVYSENYVWGFVGNVFDGITVVNKGTGLQLTSAGSGNVTLTENGTPFFVARTSETSANATNGFCLRKKDSNNYLNANYSAGKLSHWASTDAGSTFFLTEYEEAEVSVSDVDWATMYLGYAVYIPEGVNAYTVASTEGGYATLNQLEGVIPANTGVLLENEGEYTFKKAAKDLAAVAGNLLQGSAADTYVEGVAYVLANGANGIGLYKAKLNKDANGAEGTTHFKNNANKAYLVLPAEAEAPAMFSFGRGEGTTGIETAVSGEQTVVIYDLAGRRVEKMEKGIYIVNGKKVVIK